MDGGLIWVRAPAWGFVLFVACLLARPCLILMSTSMEAVWKLFMEVLFFKGRLSVCLSVFLPAWEEGARAPHLLVLPFVCRSRRVARPVDAPSRVT